MQIIKHENGVNIEGSQIPMPTAWNDPDSGINISNPILAQMEQFGYVEYIQPEPEPQPPTSEKIILDLTAELELYYDTVAQQKRYDNRLTCALRAGYAGPFQADGTVFAIWMDTCNAYAYTVMSAVLAGKRPIPPAAGLISEFPAAPW